MFAPLGFADWRCATSLISGFIAKESVVSTLEILLGGAALSTLFASRAAISFLVFTLLYTPCIAAVATIRPGVQLHPENRGRGADAVLRGVDRGLCGLYAGGDSVMNTLDWLLLALVALAAVAAIRRWRKKGAAALPRLPHCAGRCQKKES